MFPIGDENPTRRTAYVTYIIIAINVVVFLYELVLQNQAIVTSNGRLLGSALDYFLRDWAVVPLQLTASFVGEPIPHLQGVLSEPPEWITLITSQFLHGGFAHILGNMLFLWIFGNNIEDKLGHSKFLVFYLTCGILAGLTQWFFSSTSTIPSLGASGAIAGVLGAYILRFPTANVRTVIPIGIFPLIFNVPAFLYLGIWFIQQAIYGIGSLAQSNIGMQSGGIAYWAHAGGFVFGAILGPLLGLFQKDDDEPVY